MIKPGILSSRGIHGTICLGICLFLFASISRILGSEPDTVDMILRTQDPADVQINGHWNKRGPWEYAYKGGYWLENDEPKGANSVVFAPSLPVAGDYQVYTQWIKKTNNASNVKVLVNYSGGQAALTVNEKENSAVWFELGTFHFDAGSAGNVTIADEGADGVVRPEVVRFVKEHVVVDCASDLGPAMHRATGILSSFSETKPAPELVDPLHIHMFRTSMGIYGPGTGAVDNHPRMSAIAKYIQMNISNQWGYPHPQYGWPGGPNDSDYAHWKEHVTGIVQKVKDLGLQFQYDVWNEPDWYKYWPQKDPGDMEKFYLTWQNACQSIRAIQPDADITGPCIGWREKWMEDFLLWTRDHDCLPNVITWHQFGYAGEDSAVVAQNVAILKKWMADNNIKIDRFSINEYMGSDVETNPGVTAWMMDDLERAKVESAAHAAWSDADGSMEYHNFSLDGLLTNDLKPRSTWWTYKYYGDISGELVKVSYETGSVRGVAGYDQAKKEFRMVLGRGLGTGPSGMSDDIPVTVKNMAIPGIFSEGDKVRIQARRIADSKWDPVPDEPPVTVDMTAIIAGGQITLTLPKFGPSDSYAVLITR